MSEEACAWAQGQTAGNRTAKFVLMRLAAYADIEGVGWIHVPTIAGQVEADDRTVQRALRKLEKLGLIRKTGAFKYRLIPFYQLDMDGAIRAGLAAANGDKMSPFEAAPMVTPEVANGDTGVTQKKEITPPEGSNDPSSGAGAREAVSGSGSGPDLVDVAWAAFPVDGRRGPSSQREWRTAWASEIAGGASGLAILGAVRAYAGDKRAWGSSGRPKAAHTWLAEGRWEAFAPAAGVAVEAQAPSGWAGPAEIRARLVAAKGEGFAKSTLDVATWTGSAIVPRTRWGRDQLRAVLKGVEVLDPSPPGAGVAVGGQG